MSASTAITPRPTMQRLTFDPHDVSMIIEIKLTPSAADLLEITRFESMCHPDEQAFHDLREVLCNDIGAEIRAAHAVQS